MILIIALGILWIIYAFLLGFAFAAYGYEHGWDQKNP